MAAILETNISENDNIYDTLEIEDLDFDDSTLAFYYPCPCGDKFKITIVFMKLKIETNAERPSYSKMS